MADEIQKDKRSTPSPSILDEIAAEELGRPAVKAAAPGLAPAGESPTPADNAEEELRRQYQTLQEQIAAMERMQTKTDAAPSKEAAEKNEDIRDDTKAAVSEKQPAVSQAVPDAGEAVEATVAAAKTDARAKGAPVAPSAPAPPQQPPPETVDPRAADSAIAAAEDLLDEATSTFDRLEAKAQQEKTNATGEKVAAQAQKPGAATETAPADSSLKNTLFGILDQAQAGTEPAEISPASQTAVQTEELPRTSSGPADTARPHAPTAEKTAAPAKAATPDEEDAEDEDAIWNASRLTPDTVTEAEASSAPPAEAAPESAQDAAPETAAKKKTGVAHRIFSILAALNPLRYFERLVTEKEGVRTVWFVLGCLSVGITGLVLLMWLVSSM